MQSNHRPLREWIDPRRIYDPRQPAGRWVFLWGFALYPMIAIFLLMTLFLLVVESRTGPVDTDTIGIVAYLFMLVWVTATVCMCLRRLRDLGRASTWVWLVVLPGVNLLLFAYLLLKRGREASSRTAA